MTLVQVQEKIADLSTLMLQAATSMQTSNALLLSQIKDIQQSLSELADEVGDAE